MEVALRYEKVSINSRLRREAKQGNYNNNKNNNKSKPQDKLILLSLEIKLDTIMVYQVIVRKRV